MSADSSFYPPGSFITYLMKQGFKRWRPNVSDGDFDIHYLDLTRLKLDVSHFTPFLISKRLAGHEKISAEQLEPTLPEVERIANKEHGLAVLVIGGKLSTEAKAASKDSGHSRVVVVDKSDIDNIVKAKDFDTKSKLLSGALVRFISREALSPYATGRPALGGRFFGRSSLMKRILPGGANFTIIGNRRIGKTSVLSEILNQLTLQNEKYRTVEVYGGKCRSTLDVVYDILQGLDQFWAADHILTYQHAVRNLPDYIHKIADTDKQPVAVFIDELDHILDFDAKQDYELLHLLRATFLTHDSCRLFMAGFRKVMEAVRLIHHPLYNFGQAYDLPLFTREEAYEMITKPLSNLGIDLSNSDLPESIYRETSGYPELIQVHCTEIIHHFEETGTLPDATTHLTKVFDSHEHKRSVLGPFLANTNPYEQLLCYLLIRDSEKVENAGDYDFGLQDVNRVLKETGITLNLDQINTVTNNLKVSGIITPVTGRRFERFRFSVPQLAGYCISLDLNFCIDKALEDIKNSPDLMSVLLTSPDERKLPGDISSMIGK